MKELKKSTHPLGIASHLFKWTLLAFPVSCIVGSAVAFFLWLLDTVTDIRFSHPWLLYLLPVAGVLIYFAYRYFGKNSEKGNNLIIEQIHEPGGGVPTRMAPLVLFSTIVTHLFGGSAGREGTAVQMGGSLAHFIGDRLKLSKEDIRIILMTGVAAGFGAVFGTPVTGCVFALEVIAIGTMRYTALVPCLAASVLADITCSAWGVGHTKYSIRFSAAEFNTFPNLSIDPLLLLHVIVAGIAFGLAGNLFSTTVHGIKRYAYRYVPVQWLIPGVGGLVIVLLAQIPGMQDYLGLGVNHPDPHAVSIVSAFSEGGAENFSWLWKLIFTAVTIGTGFKGGEVTPLFFIGATLGNTIGTITGTPVDLMAGLGFIAVFAGAANTPIACTFMGVELFGGEFLVYYAVACFTAYYFGGKKGIYSAQWHDV